MVGMVTDTNWIDQRILYEDTDQILTNKLHGPMYYKIGDTSVYNGHVFYTLL